MNGSAYFTLNKFSNQYLDVDDILATQERVMCNFGVSVLNMGMCCKVIIPFFFFRVTTQLQYIEDFEPGHVIDGVQSCLVLTSNWQTSSWRGVTKSCSGHN